MGGMNLRQAEMDIVATTFTSSGICPLTSKDLQQFQCCISASAGESRITDLEITF